MYKNSRKHGIFSVDADSSLFTTGSNDSKLKVSEAQEIIFKQMRTSGNRAVTINNYRFTFNQFVNSQNIIYIEDINAQTIYDYLDSMNMKSTSKLARLRAIKAMLSKCLKNGWIEENFWNNIKIRTDKHIKESASQENIEKLIGLLDKNTFVGFRDTVAILVLYKTGIRIRTLGELKEKNIDFKTSTLILEGNMIKNHKLLKLPLDSELCNLLKILIRQNKIIREHFNVKNTNVFITQNGESINHSKSHTNAISKQLSKYSKEYGLKNINAHAIRRLYSKNLLKKGASVALISKALGHSNLAVTTLYLDLSTDEVAENLRKLL